MTTDARTRLLVQIFAVLGISSAACTKSVVAPDKPTDDPKTCPSDTGGDQAVWPDGEQPGGSYSGPQSVCLPMPANGDCSSYPNACVLSRYHCGFIQKGDKVLGKLSSKDSKSCCWKVEGNCAVGRPFVVGGTARLASLTSSADWRGALTLDVAGLDAETRRALADVWARDGLTEHASVASFAQLILELLAHGAPADLVRGAQEALADEIAHAERAFALASIYAGHDVAPGALDTRGAAMNAPDLADFAARTASEGCIAETIAALQLHAAADACASPELAAILRQTAEEESAHALLAYRIVRWAIAKGGAKVSAAVTGVFDRAAAHVGFGALAGSGASLRDHGILSERERHDLAVAALADVIAPAGTAFLSTSLA